MKKLADLNFEIENILGLKIEYNGSVQNFKYNGYWVTDINTNYFLKKKKKLERLLEKNINYDKKNDILFLKQMYEEVKGIYQKLIENKYDELSSYLEHKKDWNYDLTYPDNPPLSETDNVQLQNPANEFDDRQEYIEEFVEEFTKLFLESEKGKEGNEENIEFIQELKKTYENKENEGEKLDTYNQELIYAKAHLYYIISLHMELVRSVGLNLNKVLSVINRIDSYKEDEIVEPIYETSSKDENLKFDLSKINLGYLFYNLYEIGIIAKDKSDIKDERTSLKNYLNCANLYYLDNKKYAKVQKMTRGMPVTRNTESKVVNSEIVFLESLTSKLDSRINELKLILKNLNKRGL